VLKGSEIKKGRNMRSIILHPAMAGLTSNAKVTGIDPADAVLAITGETHGQ
jgi:hypothetical protein